MPRKQKQPEDKLTCGAKTRGGGSCQQRAGWGTKHPGEGRCKLHGGKSLVGEESKTFKHGLFSREATPDELTEYGNWMANFDILRPSVEETFLLFRMLKYSTGKLTSGSNVSEQLEAANFGIEALKGLSLIRQRYRAAMMGQDITVHISDRMVEDILEAVSEVIVTFVPDEQQTAAENLLWERVQDKRRNDE
jgi:hypothetical protein